MNGRSRAIFAVGPEIPYVATCVRGELKLHQRGGMSDASAGESDKYEEPPGNMAVAGSWSVRGDRRGRRPEIPSDEARPSAPGGLPFGSAEQ